MVEPLGRNTAPAIALACMMVDPEEVVLAVPSDHLIPGQAAYAKAVHRAVELAKTGKMVTFGITPGYAETGYGYIETNGETVVSFKEKPDAATAERYVASSRYLWNSGMFCFKAGTFLSELHAYAPEVHRAVVAAYEKAPTKVPLAPAKADMEAIPSISVDYAVMEKSRLVACVACPPEMGWSDLGSYDALYDELCGQKTSAPNVSPGKPEAARVDTAANVSLGLPQAVHVDARGNLIISSGKRIVLVDVADLVVVDTPDALLVARRGSTQKVKDAVDVLKQTDPGLL
jgi:mannose-1-phosphate guanylyltransferase